MDSFVDKIVYNLTELRKHVQDLKLLEVEFNKKNNVLVETVAKERDVKNEIQNLKSRLEALEKMKAAHDKCNKRYKNQTAFIDSVLL